MNCPSRTEEPEGTGFNQNPSALSAELTTRNDLNGIANARELRRIPSVGIKGEAEPVPDDDVARKKEAREGMQEVALELKGSKRHGGEESGMGMSAPDVVDEGNSGGSGGNGRGEISQYLERAKRAVITYGKFVGPGFMVRAPLPPCFNQTLMLFRSQWRTSIQEITLPTWPLALLIDSNFSSSS